MCNFPEVGRSIQATRGICRDTIILKDIPTAAALESAFFTTHCIDCMVEFPAGKVTSDVSKLVAEGLIGPTTRPCKQCLAVNFCYDCAMDSDKQLHSTSGECTLLQLLNKIPTTKSRVEPTAGDRLPPNPNYSPAEDSQIDRLMDSLSHLQYLNITDIRLALRLMVALAQSSLRATEEPNFESHPLQSNVDLLLVAHSSPLDKRYLDSQELIDMTSDVSNASQLMQIVRNQSKRRSFTVHDNLEQRKRKCHSKDFDLQHYPETQALCQVITNALTVTEGSAMETPIAVAIYSPKVSLLNHSCSPNAKYSFKALGQVEVRTLREIEPGEEVTISYIDLLQSTQERRQQLWSKYRFVCRCDRCCAHPCSVVDAQLSGVMYSGDHQEKCCNGRLVPLFRPNFSDLPDSAIFPETRHDIAFVFGNSSSPSPSSSPFPSSSPSSLCPPSSASRFSPGHLTWQCSGCARECSEQISKCASRYVEEEQQRLDSASDLFFNSDNLDLCVSNLELFLSPHYHQNDSLNASRYSVVGSIDSLFPHTFRLCSGHQMRLQGLTLLSSCLSAKAEIEDCVRSARKSAVVLALRAILVQSFVHQGEFGLTLLSQRFASEAAAALKRYDSMARRYEFTNVAESQ